MKYSVHVILGMIQKLTLGKPLIILLAHFALTCKMSETPFHP